MGIAVSGLVLVALASVANAAFSLPMKFTRRWEWENTWLVWTCFALLLLPLVTAMVTIPSLAEVYRDAGAHAVLLVALFGAGWGCAQVLFGLSIEAIGIALTFSIVLGLSAALGSLIPFLRMQASLRSSAMAGPVMLGVALVVAGVFVCAIAGHMREKIRSAQQVKASRPFAVGLVMAVASGVCASSQNLGVAFAAPLTESAARHGAAAAQVVNAVWLPLLAAGAIPNIAYCLYLLARRNSFRKFDTVSAPSHVGLTLLMALLWFFSTMLYGVATRRLGDLGVVVGWPAFMSLIVVTASMLGILTGEWKGSGKKPMLVQLCGMLLLVLAVLALARAQHTPRAEANHGQALQAPAICRNTTGATA